MKVRFCVDSGANIHSSNCQIIDTEDFGFSDESWNILSEKEKEKVLYDWAWNNAGLEIYYEDVDQD